MPVRVFANRPRARHPTEIRIRGGGRQSASSGHSGAKTLPSGTTGVKVEQPQLAVAGVAMEPP